MNVLEKFLVTFLIFVICTISSFSQDFEVSPVSLRFTAEPGDSQSKNVTVTNHSNKKTTFSLTIKDFFYEADGTERKLASNSIKRSCAEWLNINPSFLEINPNESQDVTVTIMVPAGEYSTRWTRIYVQAVKEQTTFDVDKSLSTGIAVHGAIAIEVNQSPESNSNFKATISNLAEKKSEGDSIRIFTAYVNNIGDKIIKSRVYLVVSNIQTAEETKYDPVIVRVFPESSRIVELKLPPGLPPGRYALAAVLDYWQNANLEGTQIIIEIK